MRVFVVLFLLYPWIGADFSSGEQSTDLPYIKVNETWGNLTEQIEERLNTTALNVLHTRLEALNDTIKDHLTLKKAELENVSQSLKTVRRTRVSQVQELGDNIEDINTIDGIGKDLYQGDIMPTKEQVEEIVEEISGEGGRSKRQAFRDHNYPRTTWPGARVPYFFHWSASESAKRAFRRAARMWSDITCIDIFEVGWEPEAIQVIRGRGCWSYVGKTRGIQDLSLGQGCDTTGIAAHELGHALGFYHTHARYDRDSMITVLPYNIEQGWHDQFTAQTKATNWNYGLAYDYGSIMHYGATSATRDKILKPPTMIPRDPRYYETIGSPFVSFNDVLMMNKHYNCTSKCDPRTSAKCENRGFPHPRDCSKCICPFGYGGRLCKIKPAVCGQVLNATFTQQEFTDVVGDRRFGGFPREDFRFCYYWIKAPEGQKIRAELVRFAPRGIAVDGCTYGGVEFKIKKDQRLTGTRYCSAQDAGTVVVSETNLMPIITYNRLYESSVTIRYSLV
ncbi:hypothetical protein Q1695_002251 [Nippostrongylus brasiliensis]|nr:hypothetical protein Q1695_002251 [Nippostrongylus brasiliensis]